MGRPRLWFTAPAAAGRGLLAAVLLAVAMGLTGGCGVNGAKKHYVLAEKLWSDGKYAAAVAEFEKVTAKDPHGKLGLQALYRAANTQALFLSQYEDAIRKYKAYVDAAGENKAMAWEAQKQIGDILYSKTEQYDRAIQHYKALIQQNPDAPEAPELQFRVAKGQFFLWRFDEAVQTYRGLIAKFPRSAWAERAFFEIGTTYYTRGEQHPEGVAEHGAGTRAYEQAMASYQEFLRRYPKSEWAPQAQFGIAACLEELDQLDAAYRAYEALRRSYPDPNVIEIKLARIRERKAQRSH